LNHFDSFNCKRGPAADSWPGAQGWPPQGPPQGPAHHGSQQHHQQERDGRPDPSHGHPSGAPSSWGAPPFGPPPGGAFDQPPHGTSYFAQSPRGGPFPFRPGAGPGFRHPSHPAGEDWRNFHSEGDLQPGPSPSPGGWPHAPERAPSPPLRTPREASPLRGRNPYPGFTPQGGLRDGSPSRGRHPGGLGYAPPEHRFVGHPGEGWRSFLDPQDPAAAGPSYSSAGVAPPQGPFNVHAAPSSFYPSAGPAYADFHQPMARHVREPTKAEVKDFLADWRRGKPPTP